MDKEWVFECVGIYQGRTKANKANKVPGGIAEEMHRRCDRRSADRWRNMITKVCSSTALSFAE